MNPDTSPGSCFKRSFLSYLGYVFGWSRNQSQGCRETMHVEEGYGVSRNSNSVLIKMEKISDIRKMPKLD